MNFIESIRNLWSAILALFRALIRLIFPAPTTPLVTPFTPGDGWPGTGRPIRGGRPWPGRAAAASPGAPAFFHGPQHGTPALGVPDQPVLVVLAYPTDHDPGSP